MTSAHASLEEAIRSPGQTAAAWSCLEGPWHDGKTAIHSLIQSAGRDKSRLTVVCMENDTIINK